MAKLNEPKYWIFSIVPCRPPPLRCAPFTLAESQLGAAHIDQDDITWHKLAAEDFFDSGFSTACWIARAPSNPEALSYRTGGYEVPAMGGAGGGKNDLRGVPYPKERDQLPAP